MESHACLKRRSHNFAILNAISRYLSRNTANETWQWSRKTLYVARVYLSCISISLSGFRCGGGFRCRGCTTSNLRFSILFCLLQKCKKVACSIFSSLALVDMGSPRSATPFESETKPPVCTAPHKRRRPASVAARLPLWPRWLGSARSRHAATRLEGRLASRLGHVPLQASATAALSLQALPGVDVVVAAAAPVAAIALDAALACPEWPVSVSGSAGAPACRDGSCWFVCSVAGFGEAAATTPPAVGVV